MNTEPEYRFKEQLESAIGRSINFNEIVTIHLVDYDIIDVIACINTIDQIYNVDFAEENDGAFDIWGMRADHEWRVKVRPISLRFPQKFNLSH